MVLSPGNIHGSPARAKQTGDRALARVGVAAERRDEATGHGEIGKESVHVALDPISERKTPLDTKVSLRAGRRRRRLPLEKTMSRGGRPGSRSAAQRQDRASRTQATRASSFSARRRRPRRGASHRA